MNLNIENLRYNKNYNRSGIIFWFLYEQGNKFRIFYIFTKSKFGNKFVISDFGGERDEKIDPINNTMIELIQESTYVADTVDDPINKNLQYFYDYNIFGKEVLKLITNNLVKRKVHVLYNEQKNTKNYLHICFLGFLKKLKWGDTIHNIDGQEFQEIVIHDNNHDKEIYSVCIMSKSFFQGNLKRDPQINDITSMRYLIWDTIIKNYRAIEVIEKSISHVFRIEKYKSKYAMNLQKIDSVEWMYSKEKICDKILQKDDLTGQYLLNDTEGFDYLCVAIKRDNRTGLRYVEFPKGYHFYKAMKPSDDFMTNKDFDNIYATTSTWYTNLSTAMSYIPWAEEKFNAKWKIFVYKTTRPIKLLYLMDNYNIKYLYDSILKNISTAKQKYVPNLNDQRYYSDNIVKLYREIRTLKLTTGYQILFKNQLKIMEERNLHPSITKRKVRLIDRITRYCIKLGNEDVCHSRLYFDLNRISPLLSIDKRLVNIICKYINIDGYYIDRIPSLWHLGGEFHGEIASCLSRHIFEEVDQHVYADENSVQYKAKLQEAYKLYKSKQKRYDIPYVLIKFSVYWENREAIKSFIIDNFRNYHFLIITKNSTKIYNDVVRYLEEDGLMKYIMNIEFFVEDYNELILNKLNDKNVNLAKIIDNAVQLVHLTN